MAINVKSEKLGELIDPSAEVEQLATGFTFTEGPIWNRRDEFLLFSDMPGDVRRRWSERDGVEEIMRPSNKSNGMVDDATHQADQASRDRQPEPSAAVFPCRGAIGLAERLEDRRLFLRRNPDPRVAHREE